MHTPLLLPLCVSFELHFSNFWTLVGVSDLQCYNVGSTMFRLCMRIPLEESVPLQCVYSLPPSLSPLLLSPPPCSSHHTPSFQLTQPTAQQGSGLSTTTEVCGSQPQMSGVHFMGRIMKPEKLFCGCMFIYVVASCVAVSIERLWWLRSFLFNRNFGTNTGIFFLFLLLHHSYCSLVQVAQRREEREKGEEGEGRRGRREEREKGGRFMLTCNQW